VQQLFQQQLQLQQQLEATSRALNQAQGRLQELQELQASPP
jgi:hypothetical protein